MEAAHTRWFNGWAYTGPALQLPPRTLPRSLTTAHRASIPQCSACPHTPHTPHTPRHPTHSPAAPHVEGGPPRTGHTRRPTPSGTSPPPPCMFPVPCPLFPVPPHTRMRTKRGGSSAPSSPCISSSPTPGPWHRCQIGGYSSLSSSPTVTIYVLLTITFSQKNMAAEKVKNSRLRNIPSYHLI